MQKVTADTNIYISAFHFGGVAGEFLDLVEAGAVELAISDAIMSETLRVLREKFKWPAEDLVEAEKAITALTVRVHPTERLNVITEDEPDNRILECAKAAKSDILVSGDNDLLRRGKFEDIEIMKLADLMQLLARGSRGR